MKRVFLLAGESSGDLHGAALARALRDLAPDLEIWGVGGARMEEAGVRLLLRSEGLAVVGLVEVVSKLPRLLAAHQRIRRFLAEWRPHLFVPIDFPDFNFRLLPHASRLGIPIVYFISPQVWAWRPGRIRVLRRYVRRMLVLFRFEEELYRRAGVPALWVGHPLVDELGSSFDSGSAPGSASASTSESASAWTSESASESASESPQEISPRSGSTIEERSRPPANPADRPRVVALLPGSRRSEVERIGPVLAEVRRHVDLLRAERGLSPIQWVLGAAQGVPRDAFTSLEPRSRGSAAATCHSRARLTGAGDAAPLRWVEGAREALRGADLGLVASGTVTLEAALLGVPVVVVYRIHPLTYALARRLVQVEHIAMANLVAGRRLVPEFLQGGARPEAVARAAERLLEDDAEREQIKHGLAEVAAALGPPGAARRAASALLEVLEQR